MLRVVLVMALVAASGGAWAADKLEFGPPAAWVKPAAPIAAPKPDSAAARLLLNDQQSRYGPDGVETYSEILIEVEKPEGLTAAGTLMATWSPDVETVTVHKLHLIRGGKVIDVLASGQTFTVLRRENNLERASLNGALSGVIQPEGLQVGDVIDFAATITRRDPVMKGHAEALISVVGGSVTHDLRMRRLWPKGSSMRWRQTAGLPAPKVGQSGDQVELTLAATDFQPKEGPSDAPGRFGELNQQELSDFKSWAEVSQLMAPLYQQAATIAPDSPLRDEIAKIRQASNDPKVQAAAALRLVQDRVRYLYLGMNNGGYIPATAERTWARLYGDCKGKTALLLAVLHELGIQAEPALVSTGHGDGLDERLPMIEVFDHILVRAVIGGTVYWLDGARLGDRNIDRIDMPPYRWALPVRAEGGQLERLAVRPSEIPSSDTTIRMDASAGLSIPAPVHIDMKLRGDAAQQLKFSIDNASEADREKGLRAFWQNDYDWIDIKTVKAEYDEAAGEMKLSMDGSAKMAWNAGEGYGRLYETDGAYIGAKLSFKREAGSDQDAPFALSYPNYRRSRETIQLPYGGTDFAIVGDNIDKTVAGFELKRNTSLENGVFTLLTSTRVMVPEIAAKDARAAESELNKLAATTVYIRAPSGYLPTPQEAALSSKSTPTTADEFVQRGYERQNQGDDDLALADFDAALKLDPKSAIALADRGISLIHKGRLDAAEADLTAAARLAPRNVVPLHGLGMLAVARGDRKAAITAFSQAIALDPDDDFALTQRAPLGDREQELSDLGEVLRIDPQRIDAYLARIGIYLAAGEKAKAGADMDRLASLKFSDPDALEGQGQALLNVGRKTDARRALGAAIAAKPSSVAYMLRAQTYPKDQRASALDDLTKARSLDPKAVEPQMVLAKLDIQNDDYKTAIDELAEVIKREPENTTALQLRALALEKSHQFDQALHDYDALVSLSPHEAGPLNARCWFKGTNNLQLESALKDCDDALAAKPGAAAIIDSRGMVELRLGRFDKAIADYDAALALRPDIPASLYGRGLAKLGKGDRSGANADLAAARKLYADVDKEFEGYGLKP